MIESADAGLPLRRSFLRVGGRTLARHQLDLALALDCERIVCITRSMEPELIALQHATEKAGRMFHAVSDPQELAGLVAGKDELVVFAEGLLAAPGDAAKLLEEGPAVLVQPVEAGVSAGFERIDLNHATAGLMRIPGRLVEPLFDLPADCDVPSALTRIALQAGIATRELSAAVLAGVRWVMIRSETEAYAVEGDWLSNQLGDSGPPTPGRYLARIGVLTFGPSLLHSGNASKVIALATAVVMILGLGAAWFGSVAAGLVFCAIAWVLCSAAGHLQGVERPAIGASNGPNGRIDALGWLIDLELVILMVWGSRESELQSLTGLTFAPVMLMLLVRLVPQVVHGYAANWVVDRTVLALFLAGFAGMGILPDATRIFAVLLAIASIALSAGKRG